MGGWKEETYRDEASHQVRAFGGDKEGDPPPYPTPHQNHGALGDQALNQEDGVLRPPRHRACGLDFGGWVGRLEGRHV